MTKEQARDYFGTYSNVAKVLQITKSAITQWDNQVPEKWQLELHRITKGRLRADTQILAKYRDILSAA